MPFRLRFLLLLPFAALLACGSTPSRTVTPYNFNGSWAANPTFGSLADMPFVNIAATLQTSNGVVTGTLNANTISPLCPVNGLALPVTGTLNDVHDLKLSFPIAGGTGTLLATLNNDPSTFAYGSWKVDGGACAMSATQIVMNQNAPSTPITPSPITTPLSGKWLMEATYTFPDAQFRYAVTPVSGFAGVLQFSNGVVSGTLKPSSGGGFCGNTSFKPIDVDGSLDANNKLTILLPIGTDTAIITATLGSNPQTLTDGSFSIVGTSCAMSATPMAIAQYAPVTGTYTGNFNIPDYTNPNSHIPLTGTDITITAVLTQSIWTNTSGEYLTTGTITVTGSCTETVTLTNEPLSDYIGYLGWDTDPTLAYGANPTASALTYAIYHGHRCGGQGNLIRQ